VSDAVVTLVLVAAFALAIGLVQVLGRLIDSGGRDGWADEPPDAGTAAGALVQGRARGGYPASR
jgi:hypothetical protein